MIVIILIKYTILLKDDRKVNLNSIPSLEKGDILITNGTSSFGLTGHTAIAVGSNIIIIL